MEKDTIDVKSKPAKWHVNALNIKFKRKMELEFEDI